VANGNSGHPWHPLTSCSFGMSSRRLGMSNGVSDKPGRLFLWRDGCSMTIYGLFSAFDPVDDRGELGDAPVIGSRGVAVCCQFVQAIY
jgi:hypothetical protein